MPESEPASGGAPSEPGSGGAPSEPAASGGPSVPWALVEGAGGSPVASAVSSANPDVSLEAVRAMQCVSSRLRPVPEHREIDGKDLPDAGALAGAVRELEVVEKDEVPVA